MFLLGKISLVSNAISPAFRIGGKFTDESPRGQRTRGWVCTVPGHLTGVDLSNSGNEKFFLWDHLPPLALQAIPYSWLVPSPTKLWKNVLEPSRHASLPSRNGTGSLSNFQGQNPGDLHSKAMRLNPNCHSCWFPQWPERKAKGHWASEAGV